MESDEITRKYCTCEKLCSI